jgi:hypothetical protein
MMAFKFFGEAPQEDYITAGDTMLKVKSNARKMI